MMFSFIVPLYNSSKFIIKCLSSVLNQTYTEWECIVYNDGSTDDTEALYMSNFSYDKRFKYFYHENEGVCKTTNDAIELANGEYIVFLDHDDWVELNLLEELLNIIVKYKPDVIGFQSDTFPKETWHEQNETNTGKLFFGKTYNENIDIAFHHSFLHITHSSSCIRTHVIKNKLKFYGPGYGSDTIFMNALFCLANSIVSYEKILYHRNSIDTLGRKNVNEDIKITNLEDSLRYIDIYRSCSNVPPPHIISIFHTYVAFLENRVSKTNKRRLANIGRKIYKYRRTLLNKKYFKVKYYLVLLFPFQSLLFLKAKNKLKYLIKKIYYFLSIYILRPLRFHSLTDTVEYIIANRVNVYRFGDGEFRLLNGAKSIGFQDFSVDLIDKLSLCLNIKNGTLLCLCSYHKDWKHLSIESRQYFLNWVFYSYKGIYKLLKRKKLLKYKFGAADFSRPYIDRCNFPNIASDLYFKIKNIWAGKKVLIVEGKYTRFGVGNDLLDNAYCVHRILCPATNAFKKYDKIFLSIINKKSEYDLVLISLGPTATILAYELTDESVWAIDIGHLDVDYEWFKMLVKSKTTLRYKYVNENDQGANVDNCFDETYLNSIVDIIE